MSEALKARIARGLTRDAACAVRTFGEKLGREAGAVAVLFYGSNLRTGALDGVLDYYLLLPGKPESGVWPRVSYHEWRCEGQDLRAKAATMTLAKFAQAASGELLDTTIWARFVQPSALIWRESDAAAADICAAVASATATAARLAAVLGPETGEDDEFWNALFQATYGAEFRIESTNRAQSILDLNREHFDGLLPLALDAAEIAYQRSGLRISPEIPAARRNQIKRWWKKRRRMGKLLNLRRLLRAASTFDGAARYAAWKIERHTGVAVDVTPWRERHPVLAAPGVLLSVWRKQRKRR